jgi:undecaprenyl-diphosphatase
MALQIRFIAKTCGLNGSFTSSHATNHFAIAMFVYQMFKKISPLWAISFLWAGLISYAQVYVGVHYPLDIIGGALLGNGLGYLFARIFNNKIGLGLS